MEGQQHPVGLYLKVWALLFVLSALSYLVDVLHVQGLLRWALILALMMAKAGLIVAVFMHLRWERLALVCLVVVPPAALLVLAGMMATESGYIHMLRSVPLR
jgi:caa(3)-type oxidase subunit IV